MDIYEIIASWLGWPIVTAIIILSGSYGFWALKNRIETLKEVNDLLNRELEISKLQTPENLMAQNKQLAENVKVRDVEIESNKSTISELREELRKSKYRADNLGKVLKKRNEFPLPNCPYCGASIIDMTSEKKTYDGPYGGTINLRSGVYSCGLELTEFDSVNKKCSSM